MWLTWLICRVPPHHFPLGKWASGKTPRVSKDKVKFLHRASIAEVCFTDTFETDDSENIGGALADECHQRGVKSAYICPYTPEQNYAEGYLGRITAMASFAMVYSGAPIHLWIYFWVWMLSSKTKKVLFRQDVIFLPNVFPMREARMMGHLAPR